MCTSDYPEEDKKKANDPKNHIDEATKKRTIYDKRSCTDIPMCIIFFIFFCGLFATAAYGYKNGDPYRLITPFDSNGNMCGQQNNITADYPYLYWPELYKGNINLTVCAKSCPQEAEVVYCIGVQDYTCDYGIMDFSGNTNYSIFNTTLYMKRYCIPMDNVAGMKNTLLNSSGGVKLGQYVGDLGTCWWLFLVMLGISTTIALIYLLLLRCIAKPLLYISFVLILVILVAGGAYVFASNDRYVQGDKTKSIMKGMGILLWILAAIYLVILFCCCSRIRLGIAIMEVTSDFIRGNMGILLVPLVFFFIIAVWVTWWIISALWIYSCGTPVRSSYGPISQIMWYDSTRYLWLYHLFGLFWVNAFLIGCAQMVIAGATIIWYFAQGGVSDDKAKFATCQGFKWLFRYHMGSVAFGALIIAIMQAIKLAFEYFVRKFKKATGNNPCTKCIVCCCRCFINCLDRIVRTITKNAYIQVLISDRFFCASCFATFYLFVRNAGRFTIVGSIGSILMLLGKTIIISSSGLIAYIIIVNAKKLKDNVSSPIFPTIVCAVIAYLIGSVFLSVYSFSSTTILHCFIYTEEIGVKEHPKKLNDFLKIYDNETAKNHCCASKKPAQTAVHQNQENNADSGPKEHHEGGDGPKANNMS